MIPTACLLAAAVFPGPQDKAPPPKPPDGVYAVQRDSTEKKDVLPLRAGEVLLVNRHRYLKKGDAEPPRFVVVRSAPEVALDLAGEPKAVKDGDGLRILLKLRPKAAAALERLTRERRGRQVAIVLGGEVVTTHKVRAVIKGGAVQITSCAPGAADYLLGQLRKNYKKM